MYKNKLRVVQIYSGLLFLLTSLLTIPAFAQTSAGSLMQQLQSEQPLMALPPVKPGAAPEKLAPTMPGQQQVLIKQFKFTGNKELSDADLQALVAPYKNTTMSFAQIKGLTELVGEYYRRKGWLARALVPAQDVTEGVLTIQVVEAVVGGILIDNQSKRVSTERVESWIGSHLPQHSGLSLDKLDRAMLTLNDLPDVNAVSSLLSGKKEGETDLNVLVTDKPRVDGFLDVDNFGDPSTGMWRAVGNLYVNSPLGFGDQAIVYGLYSEGVTFGRLSYTVPVGMDGLRLGVNASALNYRVTNRSWDALRLGGQSQSGGLEASYPILRSRPANLYAIGLYNYSNYENRSDGNITNRYKTSVLSAGVSGNLMDGLGGGGTSTGALIFSAGDIMLNGSPLQSFNEETINTGGKFTKLRYSLNRLQNITQDVSGYVALSGQWASRNMDSSEQMFMGGPYAVRAYAPGQGAASQGNLLTAELRMRLPHQFLVTAFYDLANVQSLKDSNYPGNAGANTYLLQGLGLSLTWNAPKNILIRATWAHRTGGLSDAAKTYLTNNGGLSPNRFWLNTSISF
jgi:hemolysin activation/secretion protein